MSIITVSTITSVTVYFVRRLFLLSKTYSESVGINL